MGGGMPSASLAHLVSRENGGCDEGGDTDGDRSDAPVGRTHAKGPRVAAGPC
jgi:hypothetical protein